MKHEEKPKLYRTVSVKERLPEPYKMVIWIMINDIAMDNETSTMGAYTEIEGKWLVECQDNNYFSPNDFTHWLEEVELPNSENLPVYFYFEESGAKWLLNLILNKK